MAYPIFAITLASVVLASIGVALLRFHHTLSRPKQPRHRGEKTHLLIVLGSGGHSAEMLAMLERAVRYEDEKMRLNWRDYNFRTWLVGESDSISERRAKEFEEMVEGLPKKKLDPNGSIEAVKYPNYRMATVPRAREIHQSILTAPVSCLRCLLTCWNVLLPPVAYSDVEFPDLILCNGPATATILVFTSVLLRFFDVRGCHSRGKMRTVYVESWARVKRLSLSGKLMLKVVDRFIVQWPQLLEKMGGEGEYLGVLV